MHVSEIMSRKVTACTPNSTLQDAARLMEDQDCGAIPVLEEDSGKLIGIVTDRDITCRAVAHGRDPRETPVRECMSNALVTVEPEADLNECCQIMEKEQIRRVPVVDKSGKCCGMIFQADIARRADERAVASVIRDVSRPPGGGTWAHTVP